MKKRKDKHESWLPISARNEFEKRLDAKKRNFEFIAGAVVALHAYMEQGKRSLVKQRHFKSVELIARFVFEFEDCFDAEGWKQVQFHLLQLLAARLSLSAVQKVRKLAV